MFRLYSKGCEYAIRAMLHMVPGEEPQWFQAKMVCKKAGIPESFTRKIFQALVGGGFLNASRGPGGGYMINKNPTDITLLEIIESVDGEDTFEGCILGLSTCNSKKPCPLHHTWKNTRDNLTEQLESKTLQDLIDTDRKRTKRK